MIDEREVERTTRRANRWLALYVVLLVVAALSVVGPWWLTVIAITAAVAAGLVYWLRSTEAWDTLLDWDEQTFGVKTWKHKRRKDR